MRHLLLATISTLTAFAFVTPTMSKPASAQLFEDTPPVGASPSVTDNRSGSGPQSGSSPQSMDRGYEEGYSTGYGDATSGREYDSTYEGYDDDNTVEDEVNGVFRDAAEDGMSNASSDDEGLEPEFEEELEDGLGNQ
ncbi:MAG: hypothetical protein WBA57_05030 [Elainellaceae cyanobacterium]